MIINLKSQTDLSGFYFVYEGFCNERVINLYYLLSFMFEEIIIYEGSKLLCKKSRFHFTLQNIQCTSSVLVSMYLFTHVRQHSFSHKHIIFFLVVLLYFSLHIGHSRLSISIISILFYYKNSRTFYLVFLIN